MTRAATQASADQFIISRTAYQSGYGTDRYKRVYGLSQSERALVNDGTPVYFRAARLSHPMSPRGTYWRLANPGRYGTRFFPRVPEPDTVARLQKLTGKR